jgi:phosphinothricin acetyltransferase
MNKKIRLATEADSAQILEIYKPFIMDTVITFEYDVPSLVDFTKRINNIQKKYPWLVCEIDGNIVGYAYASPFHERAAYDWSVDFSIYINPKYHGKRIGKALYFALVEVLKLQGYCNAYALVTLPNVKSEGIHESFGFKSVGVCKKVGYKFGEWRDVKWFELELQKHSKVPPVLKIINEISNTIEFNKIIEEAEQIIIE